MIQTLSDKLLALFSTLEWDNKPFVNVYDYHTLENNWYPYMTFEPVWFNAIISDSCNNERTYTFQCLLFQEITETGGRKEAKEIIVKAISDVIKLLDENYTLDWTVTMVQPVWWTITPFVISNGKALVCELSLEVRTIEFIW